MNEREDTVIVFTARSPKRIIKEGGSQSWVLNPARAKRCTWLVCTQNQHNPDHEFSDATEPHGAGFLLGKISAVRKSEEPNEQTRWRIEISQFAQINYPDLWEGRNPVQYTTLDQLGISLDSIKFEPMPVVREGTVQATSANLSSVSLTIPEAKRALALTFGVKPEAVEITIRG